MDVRRPAKTRRLVAIGLSLMVAVSGLIGVTVATAPPASALPANFQDQELWSNLEVPTELAFAPDGKVFVAEKGGTIQRFDSLTDTTPTQVADLRTAVHNWGDRGLLGLAVDPNFSAARPYIYVQYSYDHILGSASPAPRWGAPGQTYDDCPTPPSGDVDGCVVSGRISKLTLAGVGGVVTNEQVLVEDWCQQYASHSIGTILFGTDGKLYAAGGDGASFNGVDYGQGGGTLPNSSNPTIPKNPCGDPPAAIGGNQVPSTAKGGALRAQAPGITARESTTGKVSLSGSMIRIDPDTGAGVAGNPWFTKAGADDNEKRIIAYGLRNPFRFSMRGGTNEIWVGDVGWNNWEEINTIPDATTLTAPINFGWPCYEGNGRQSGYDGTNIGVCENLYTQGAGAVQAPVYNYNHGSNVVAGDGCGGGGSSIAGAAYYNRPTGAGITPYPANYDGSLFFTDYNRRCIWRLRPGTNGRPDPNQPELFEKLTGGVVDLVVGPNGDIFYPNIDNGTINRIRYFPTNSPPVASFTASPTSGAAPLTVNFNASASTDVDGGALTYAWDLDGNGLYNDATGVTTSRTYAAGNVTVGLRVTDSQGASGTASVLISPGNTPPTATITTPNSGLTWKVGDSISFSGSGFDTEDGGALPASKLSWLVSLLSCDDQGNNCVTRRSDPFTGVAGGTTVAPDWSGEGNNLLEFKLTATDSTGLTNVKTVRLTPQKVTMTFQSNPTGLQLTAASDTKTAPFSRTVIVGSQNTLAAPSPQLLGGKTYQFTGWSDGGAVSHTVSAPASATTYTATYVEIANPGLVASYGFEAGSGTTIADSSVFGNTGTAAATTWNTTGKFGNSLTFNGTSSRVNVPDASSLDLTTGATVEAWVNPSTVAPAWNTTVMKENLAAGDLSYALEANTPYGGAGGWNVVGTTTRAAENPARLPANTWTHTTMTYDGSNIRYYENGTLVTTTPATGSVTNGNGPLSIGGNTIWGEYFTGRIDEVRVYNRALTAAEIVVDRDTPIASDTTPPSAPGTLTATGALGRVNLSWGAATDNIGVAGYDVHRSTTAGFTPSVANRVAQPTGTTYADIVPAGTYYYRVIARDGTGNVGAASNQASATASADQVPSAPGTVTATGSLGRVTLAWSAATDDVGVARYDVFRGTTSGFTPAVANRIAQPTTPGYVDNVAAGTYFYRVIAVDTAGQSGPASNEATGTATADTTAPTVSVTAPANNATVSGTVAITATAADNVAVAGVQFKIDGVNFGSEDTVAPYATSWDSRTASNAAHAISAVARDAQGNTTTAAVGVIVANTAPTGLVAAYGFEAGSGTSIADSSAVGNTGTAAATTWNTTGKFGNSLTFNGTSSRVNVPDASSLDLTTGATVEAWVYPTSVAPAWNTTVMKENTAAGDLSYALEANTPYGGAGGWNVIGTTTRAAENAARLPVNSWTHTVMTYDGSNIRFYQDGVLVATTPATGNMTNGNGPLSIGGNTIWGEYFTGRIDEVRVYNRALTAAEIVVDRDTPIAADSTPPSAPGTLTATGALGRVNLSWGAATDNIGVAGYDVHRSTTAGFTPSVANRVAQPTGTTYADIVGAGTYYYRVIARDGTGNVGPASNEASGTATADQPPSAPGTVTATGSLGQVTLAWSAATDDVGVARYDVHRSTTAGFTPAVANRIAQPTTPGYVDNVAAGTYFYRVIAVDTAGQSGPASNQATGTATADTTAPTVSITAPANNATVSGTVAVTATAADNVAVAGVQFKIDGVNVGSEDTVAPYTASWDSRTVSNATHTISAVARDASANSTTTSISVTVANTAPTGLVAAYNFNAGSGTAIADNSGNGRSGTASSPVWNTTGKYGNSLTFNSAANLVTVADNAALDLTTGATLEAWVYPTTTDTAWRTILMKENPAAGDLSYALEANTPYGGAGGWQVVGTSTRAAENTARLPVNTWTHVAMTYDGANLRFYQGGVLISTIASTGSMTNGNGGLIIGGTSIWPAEFFAGRIDEVRVYNRALTAAEIVVDRDTAI